ncbi:MAG: glycosyltransferase family 2 protein [Oscillospiraceae bacterium]|nr:glycosyltransferase family 2 protein [Oscillospiraceae bacterium]
MIDVSLVIPFLNEEENLGELMSQLDEYAHTQSFAIEAVFVDDGSTDSSVEILRKMNPQNVKVRLIRLSKNFGSHAAIRAGITQASGKYTMFFSADLQEPFSMIDEMFSKSLEGYDIVMARKASVQIPFFERLFSNLYTSLIRKYAIKDYPAGGANNILFSKKVKEQICNNAENNSSIFLQICSFGFKRTSIDVSLNQRHKGQSKWTFSKRVKLFIDSFVAFSYTPIRVISLMGILLFLAGVIYALWIVIARLTGFVDFDAGFPTLVSVLLVGFGLTNFSLSVVAEYIWRTLDASRNRPVFIIDTVEELPKGDTA